MLFNKLEAKRKNGEKREKRAGATDRDIYIDDEQQVVPRPKLLICY